MPPYQRHQLVSSDLIRRLQRGEWKIGEKFPTVDGLLPDYEFSRGTVFKGIQQLVDEGYLAVRKSVGTFVVRTESRKNIGLLMNDAYLRPQQTPFPYVLGQKIMTSLEEGGFCATRYLELPGQEFEGLLNIEHFASDLQNRRLSGIVMANCNFGFLMKRSQLWQKYAVPYVTVNPCGESSCCVAYDYAELLRLAFQYFSSQGRRKIALFCGDSFVPLLDELRSSFPHLEFRPEWIFPLSLKPSPEENGFHLMSRLWMQEDKPDALFVADDIAMKGVVQAVLRMNLVIPRELSLIHAANSDTNVFYPLAMPRIEYDTNQTVQEAIGLLLRSMSRTEPENLKKMIVPVFREADNEALELKIAL
ncbi:MAG: hypothetical protein A2X49_10425 [Lentisphaerae bacterium GWF2_52_8]|nr:MAG: hypothetical protein A2X49_10425 [Lentisphaerae bacterium GWF2_52_8]